MSQGSGAFEPYPRAEAVWRYLRRRFGFGPRAFEAFRLWHRPGAQTVWIAHRDCLPDAWTGPETIGLPVLRRPLPRGFPTTSFLQRFGLLAARNVIWVGEPGAEALMQGQRLQLDASGTAKGPFIVRTRDAVLGRGWVREARLALDIPKEWRSGGESP